MGVSTDHIKYRDLSSGESFFLHKDIAALTLRLADNYDPDNCTVYDGTNAVSVFGPFGAHIWNKSVKRATHYNPNHFIVTFSYRAKPNDRVNSIVLRLGQDDTDENVCYLFVFIYMNNPICIYERVLFIY